MTKMIILARFLPWVQIILSVLMIGTILLQQSEAGLGTVFGGGQEANIFRTKRGLEKTIFISTIVLAVLFAVTALLALFV